jgi:hypothetical protein
MNPNHAKLPNNSFRFVVKTPDDFLISYLTQLKLG